MSSNREISMTQKRVLHTLLLVKKELDEMGVSSHSLTRGINAAKTEMVAEDIAFVEKMISELEL